MEYKNKEYIAINLIREYKQPLNGCKWAIATDLSEEEFASKYPEENKRYSPFIKMTMRQRIPIVDSNRNEEKHKKRMKASVSMESLVAFETKYLPDNLITQDFFSLYIEKMDSYKAKSERNENIKVLFKKISRRQYQRLIKRYVHKISVADIAAEENKSVQAVSRDMANAIEILRKEYKEIFNRDI